LQDVVGRKRHVVDEVLAVVEYQECLSGNQGHGKRRDRFKSPGEGRLDGTRNCAGKKGPVA